VDFRLDDEQRALQETVASYCASRYPIDGVAERPVGGAGSGSSSETGWKELAQLGVFSLLVPEEDGGLGLGLVEATIVFEQLGLHLVDGPLLWSTLAARALPGVVDGDVVVAGSERLDGTTTATLVEHADLLDTLVVLRDAGVFAIDRAQLPESTALEPLDPLTPVAVFESLPEGTMIGGPDAVERWEAEGTVLAAALLLGVSESALRVARDYSLEREQFGQPIGSFQALKHVMADMFVRTNLARSATYAAAAVLDDPVVGDGPRAVHAAKLLAGEAAVDNGRAAVQVLGGMGFTWDMPPNFQLKRAWVLEQTFGTSEAHALAISESLAERGR
jgi:alkylation response protein AidB-like acyl-CoA dehydrogenase